MVDKKSVLIIARQFLPYSNTLGGVIRVSKIANFLHANGYQVHILAARGFEVNWFGLKDSMSKHKLHYYTDKFCEIECNHYINSKNNNSKNEKDNLKIKFMKFGNKCLNEFLIPDKGSLFSKNATKAAFKIIKDNNIKNIICSAPPPTSAYIGYKIKNKLKSKINFILDYRDSWNGIPLYSKKNWLFNKISRKLEANIMKTCNHYTYVTEPTLNKSKAISKIKNLKNKSTLIMNVSDVKIDVKKNNSRKSNKIIIGHFGSLNEIYRDPKQIFELIKTNFPNDFEFHLYGDHNYDNYDFVKGFDSVNHATVIEKMQDMDLLWLIHTEKVSGDENIPGKFFEYILTHKPIYVYFPKNSETGRVVEENKLGYVSPLFTEDKDETKKVLLKIIEDFKEGNEIKYSEDDIKDFEFEQMFSKWLEILK